jgi:hypothetical protein
MWHAVRPGEVWAHWSPGPGLLLGLGGGTRALMCTDAEGPVVDVTDVLRCAVRGFASPGRLVALPAAFYSP